MSFTLAGVRYTYPGGQRAVLAGVNLTIRAGATTAVLGVSGAGKSTLLYLLGLLWEGALGAGRIEYHDGARAHNYGDLRPIEKSRLRLRDFGFALQSSYLLPHFTCAQNVAMPLAMSGREAAERSALVADLIRRADAARGSDDDGALSRVKDTLAGEVSGGQKQRIAVLRSIVHDPQVVFADEPFSSLDARNTELILDLLRAWRLGELPHSRPDPVVPRTLIVVCHDLRIAYDYAEDFVILDGDGRVYEDRAIPKASLPGEEADLRAWMESEVRR